MNESKVIFQFLENEIVGVNLKFIDGKFDVLGYVHHKISGGIYTPNLGDIALKLIISDLKNISPNLHIENNKIEVILPDNYAITQLLKMPNLSEDELISSIKYQANEYLPWPIETTNMDIQVLSQNPNEAEIDLLLVATPASTVDNIVKIISHFGGELAGVQSQTSAFISLILDYYSKLPNANGTEISLGNSYFLSCAQKSTTIIHFDLSISKVIAIKTYPIGRVNFEQEIESKFGRLTDLKKTEILTKIGLMGPQGLGSIMQNSYTTLLASVEEFLKTNSQQDSTDKSNDKNIFMFGTGTQIANLTQKLSADLSSKVIQFDLASQMNLNNFLIKEEANAYLLPLLGASIMPNL